MIMHHHSAREPFRNVAARLADPVERMVLARGRVQPMQGACDPKAGFEMADLGFSHPPLDGAIDAVQMRSLLARPGGQARRTDMGRADEVRKRLRRPVLRQKLLDVEIDRRRPDAFAILRRRDHPVGKLGPRHAPAMRAGVNHGLALGHLDQPLGQVEHLQVEHLHELGASPCPSASTPVSLSNCSAARQWRQTSASCRTTRSGFDTRLSVSPL